jgi:hypothetical protein
VIRYWIARQAMPNELPPWYADYQQAHHSLAAAVF